MNAHDYAQDLIRFDSVSNLSNQLVSQYLDDALQTLGFETEIVPYRDSRDVLKVNVVARKGPRGEGGLAYFAHSDVVPAADWHDSEYGPFDPRIDGDRLYGRGSCDMKGSIASMLAAVSQRAKASFDRPLYVVVTADEEVGFHGDRWLSLN